MEDDGVEAPYGESRVEDDWAVGTVPLEILEDLESLDELSLLLVFFRRKSLKNGIIQGVCRDVRQRRFNSSVGCPFTK